VDGWMDGLRPIAILLVGLLGAVTALAQKTTNFTFDYFALFGAYVTNQSTSEDNVRVRLDRFGGISGECHTRNPLCDQLRNEWAGESSSICSRAVLQCDR
jgi:hypothetical protein